MGSNLRRKNQVWCMPPLSPLLEGPDPNEQRGSSKESSWETIRSWVRVQLEKTAAGNSFQTHRNRSSKRMDLKLILGVLGCPLAPIPLPGEWSFRFSIKDNPKETSTARYIIQQYLAATGCLKVEKGTKSMYVAGSVWCNTGERSAKGCFVVWQMSPGMWLMELVADGYKVVAGSNGKIVWRHLPWLGMNAARGPQRPLRRMIQGLDPETTASMFTNAQCLGEKRIQGHDCFVLKASADQASIADRSDGPAEVIRHVLYGYFSQKSGLLVYAEDSHLTRVQTSSGCGGAIYWETTIGSSIDDYRDVEGVLVAHKGRSVATLFRFGEADEQQSRIRLEEAWRINDVAFNVAGLSFDCFIPPLEILNVGNNS